MFKTRHPYPFAAAPRLGCPTGAYLLGLMPPELLATLDIALPLVRRDPHYFLPTTDRRYLLLVPPLAILAGLRLSSGPLVAPSSGM